MKNYDASSGGGGGGRNLAVLCTVVTLHLQTMFVVPEHGGLILTSKVMSHHLEKTKLVRGHTAKLSRNNDSLAKNDVNAIHTYRYK